MICVLSTRKPNPSHDAASGHATTRTTRRIVVSCWAVPGGSDENVWAIRIVVFKCGSGREKAQHAAPGAQLPTSLFVPAAEQMAHPAARQPQRLGLLAGAGSIAGFVSSLRLSSVRCFELDAAPAPRPPTPPPSVQGRCASTPGCSPRGRALAVQYPRSTAHSHLAWAA